MKEWSVVLFGHEYLMAARSYAEAVRQVWELFDECGIDPEKDCLAGADAGYSITSAQFGHHRTR